MDEPTLLPYTYIYIIICNIYTRKYKGFNKQTLCCKGGCLLDVNIIRVPKKKKKKDYNI